MILKKLGLFALLIFVSINVFAKETLLFSFDVIRHGDRTPLRVMPNYPFTWSEGLGQLTPLGMQQEFQRGVEFRKKYVDEYHLLSPHYQRQEMIVFSTNADRAIMSAQSVLLGLYPQSTGPELNQLKIPALPYYFQPIPIHIKAKNGSDIIDNDVVTNHDLLKKYVYTQSQWQSKNKALKAQFLKWSQVTGIKIHNLHQVRHLADILLVYQLHHVPMPAGLSAEDVKQIIALGTEESLAEYKTKQIADILGANLLKTIRSYMIQASKQKTPLKYVLFSGHDSSIMSLMTEMQVPLTVKPSYGADLNFSLYKTSSHQMLVKVTYNGEQVIPAGCDKNGCTLAQFLN